MRYKIIESGSAAKLATLVNLAILDGWVPLGGHFVEPHLESRTYNRFSQAMTHPELPPVEDPRPIPDSTGVSPLFESPESGDA